MVVMVTGRTILIVVTMGLTILIDLLQKLLLMLQAHDVGKHACNTDHTHIIAPFLDHLQQCTP